jgi:large subunit ribosomal protein L31
MKTAIHPKYFKETIISCSCGATLHVGATQENMQTEICSSCHPIYTGKKKTVDATGRVDRFKKLAERAEKKRTVSEKTREEKAKREADRGAKAQESDRTISKKKLTELKKKIDKKESSQK